MPPRIVIIGAGPAGSAAAVGLAQRGFGVTIVERASFPRLKVCGEFISPGATDILESLLPAHELRRAGAQRIGELVIERGERELCWKMPAPAWAIGRETLDAMLLARAVDAGARVIQPANVERVAYHNDRVITHIGGREPLESDLIIHADGTGRHESAPPTPNRPGVVGLKCHLTPPPGKITGIRMRTVPRLGGAYIGTVRIESGQATLAMVVRSALVARHKSDHDALLRELWPGFDAAWRSSPWLACPVPGSGYIEPGHARSFRIGNAAAAVEPVGGEGIGLALWAGVTLGEMLGARQGSNLDLDELKSTHRAFAKLYRARLRLRRPSCRLAAEALMRPWIVAALWPVLSVAPLREAMIAPWYALTGKPV